MVKDIIMINNMEGVLDIMFKCKIRFENVIVVLCKYGL